ncbi:uncharacterized protein LOC111060483 isoform X2 [Nilaparvata lugens]|uniref:uncharacterized protein LOC111060483 isoform X2 n=1 Tax=Nilaparvata lugens TaxID=108931 RepID=UPI00193D543B|nr:uncharacterized protein LOC111060483 isoform X2 [Nilaparvata lugens]
MEALDIIQSTQLVIIIFYSSSVLLSSSTTISYPPTPSSKVEIFNKVIKGIMTRLTFIANGGGSAQEPVETLGESTVSTLNRKYPNNEFVQKLLKEVQGGRVLNRDGFVKFLIRNAGFLAKALEICITYKQDGTAKEKLLEGYISLEDMKRRSRRLLRGNHKNNQEKVVGNRYHNNLNS